MVREVLTLSCDEAGLRLGDELWIQYCKEYGVLANDQIGCVSYNGWFGCFFEETNDALFATSSLSLELEASVTDVSNGGLSNLFEQECLLNGEKDYTVGKAIIDAVSDRIRKYVDNCDHVQGFAVNDIVDGIMRSGLSVILTLERMAIHYRKKSKLGFDIYPNAAISNGVEQYNALLATNWLFNHTELSLLLDNEAIYGLCQKNLHIKPPCYDKSNRLICQDSYSSSVTASLKEFGDINVVINKYQRNFEHDIGSIYQPCFSTSSFVIKLSSVKGVTL